MKLYLSSYFLGNEPEKFSELFTDNKRVAIIMNAADTYDAAQRPNYLARAVASLAEIGLKSDELDLRDYFNDPAGLTVRLAMYGGVWVMGGNSFTLRRAMRQSGFDHVAYDPIKRNELVYGGFSAGAVVATPTLKGIELVDDPYAIPDGYNSEVIWDGLGLYGFSIAPHYKSNHPESTTIDEVVSYFERNNMPYKPLHDGEAIVVKENMGNI